MKNNLLLIAFFGLLLQNCSSQDSNYIGEGIYNLDNINFKIPLDTIASKIPYNIMLPLTDAYYDKELKKRIVTDTFAYQRKIKGFKSFKDKTSIPLFYFLDANFTIDFVSFYLDKSKNLQAFSFIDSREESFDDVIVNIRKKYGEYEILLKEDKQLSLANAEKFQWETPDKIIAVMRSTKKIGDTYTFNLTVIKKPLNNTFPVNRISKAPLCLDDTCRK